MSEKNTEPEQEPQKHPGGRPLKYDNVADLDQAIDAYFNDCDPHQEERLVENGVNQRGETIWIKRQVMTEQKPYLVTGLAVSLGVSRRTLLDYAERPEFLHSIERAKDRCEAYAESQLYGPYANGARFNLINNYRGKHQDWQEKTNVDHTTDGQPMKALVEFVGDATDPADDNS